MPDVHRPHARLISDPANETPTEAQLAGLVDTFYARVREDDLIGPVFESVVEDWPHHLQKLTAFWTRVVLGASDYRGNPMMAHVALRDRITPAHFERWLALWTEVTNAVLPGPIADELQERAARMSQRLQAGMASHLAR